MIGYTSNSRLILLLSIYLCLSFTTTNVFAEKAEFKNHCQVPSESGWKKVNWWLVLKESGAINNKVKYTLFFNDGTTEKFASNTQHYGVSFIDFIETIERPHCEMDDVKVYQSWFHEDSKAKYSKLFDKPTTAKYSHAHAKYLISHDKQYNGFIVDHSLPIPYTDAVFGESKSNPSQHAFCFNFERAGFEQIMSLLRVSRPMIVKTNIDKKSCQKEESPLWNRKFPSAFTLSYEQLDDDAEECKKAWQSDITTFDDIINKPYPPQCYKRTSIDTATPTLKIDTFAFYPRDQDEDHLCFKNPTSKVDKITTNMVGKKLVEVVESYTWRPFYKVGCTEDMKIADYAKPTKHICSPVEYGIDSWLAVSKIMNKLLYVSTQNQNSNFPSMINSVGDKHWGVYEINSFFDNADKHEKVGVEHGKGKTVCIGDSNRARGQLHHMGNIFCFEDETLAKSLRAMLSETPKTKVTKVFNTVNLLGDGTSLGPAFVKETIVFDDSDDDDGSTKYPSFYFPKNINGIKNYDKLIESLTGLDKCGLVVMDEKEIAKRKKEQERRKRKKGEPVEAPVYTDLGKPLFNVEYILEPTIDEDDKIPQYNVNAEEDVKWEWIKLFYDLYRGYDLSTAKDVKDRFNNPLHEIHRKYYFTNLVRVYKSYTYYLESGKDKGGPTFYPARCFQALYYCDNQRFPNGNLNMKDFIKLIGKSLLERIEEKMTKPISVPGYNLNCIKKEVIDFSPRPPIDTRPINPICRQNIPTCVDPLRGFEPPVSTNRGRRPGTNVELLSGDPKFSKLGEATAPTRYEPGLPRTADPPTTPIAAPSNSNAMDTSK